MRHRLVGARGPRGARVLALVLALALVLVTGVAVAGCGGDEAATGPPEIEYGRDVCTECHMIISEARYAAAARDADGEPFVFDDIGDMFTYAARTGIVDDGAFWVHDYDTEEWVDARTAWYVRSDLETPMGHGVVAFGAVEAAEAFAEGRDGEVLRWQDMIVEFEQ